MRFVFLLCVMGLIGGLMGASAPAAAQPDGWSVVIYDHGLNALVDLTPEGIDVIALPEVDGLPPPKNYYLEYRFTRVMITADRRYVIAFVERADPYRIDAIIIDRSSSAVILVDLPPLTGEEFFVYYRFGAFNPAQTEIALAYISHDLAVGGGCCNSGGMVTVDLATGQISHAMASSERFPARRGSTAWVDDWTEAGIWFAPRCSTCTPPESYQYLVWDRAADSIMETDVFLNRVRSERLPATGELLYSQHHPAFPVGGSQSRFMPNNAVVVYPPDANPPDDRGQVVFYDQAKIDFAAARWIMNGAAFVVASSQQYVVVKRDGRQLTIDYARPEAFVAMTTGGWLTFDRTRRQIVQYMVTEQEIARYVRYQGQGDVMVAHVNSPPVPDPLPSFAVDIAPLDVFFCPGALPSRLQPGDWAEVIDHELGVFFSTLFVYDGAFDMQAWDRREVLSPRARVQILAGRGCDGIAEGFVRVNYQGEAGWMTEVRHMNYFLVPVAAEAPAS